MFDLAFAVLLVIVFIGTGRAFVKKSKFNDLSLADNLVASFALGFGIFGTIVFLLGILGLLSEIYLFLLLVSGCIITMLNIAFIKDVFFGLKNIHKNLNGDWFLKVLFLISVLFLLINTFASLAPISSMDALVYHYAIPKLYLNAGEIYDIRGYLYSHLPQLSEMINMLAMALKSDISANILNSFVGVFASLAAYCLVKKLFDKRVAFIAAALFYCSSFITWEATGSFIELHLTLFCILSLHFALLYFEKKVKANILLSAIFLGFAFQLKIFASAFLIIVSMVFLYEFLQKKTTFIPLRKTYVLWLMTAAVFGCAWYVFNLITTGNPVFPFFYNILGGEGWNETANRILLSSNTMYGTGKSLLSFLKMPFVLTFYGDVFDHAELIGPLILLLAPFSFMKREKRKTVLMLAGFCIFYFVFWFFASQQARFFLPIVPLLFALVAVGFINLIELNKSSLRIISKLTVLLFLIFSLAISGFFMSRFAKVILGYEKKNQFLSRTVWGHESIEWMNKNLNPNDKVLFAGFGPYYLNVPYQEGRTGIQGDVEYDKFQTSQKLKEHLKSKGITHLYIWGYSLTMNNMDLWESLKNEHLEIIYEKERMLSSRRTTQLNDLKEKTTVYKIK